VADTPFSDPIAHARPTGDGKFELHLLPDHLRKVATLAREFAKAFGGGDWAHLAGLWHDLGKFRPRFQKYIRNATGFEADAHIKGELGRAPHSTAGALLACDRFGPAGRVLAYLIAGHHAGLYDWDSENSSLRSRLNLQDSRDELREAVAVAPPAEILDHGAFAPDLGAVPGGLNGFSMWVRMLFSCLVDADFLDTESFMDPDKSGRREGWPEIRELLAHFDRHMSSLADSLEDKADPTPVNRLRADVLRQCREKAAQAPGLFSLDVPTGGGKTLSSMAFALEHAKQHGKQRVIYVIPYTSIIEQTADVFRKIFGDAVIEHHSNAETEPGGETHKSRLACENWDAPVVVTTNVQFFESLFAARTSRVRKLHNIVNSVVVLDEAQLLPPEFLQPILDALNLLTLHYGVTVVLCTATQPALATQRYFDRGMRGLDGVREIISDPEALHRDLDRVTVRLPADWNAPVAWDALAGELAAHPSVLTIVNQREHARELHHLMPAGTLHLSALMCGAHRKHVIDRIKERLREGQPTRVVSTQLVEAGVDLDFPVVYRAVAGLDSIAQAAGRCNREGRLERGEVVVFVPPQSDPSGLLRKGADSCKKVLHDYSGNPLSRERFSDYFRHFYHACNLDKHKICHLLKVDGDSLAVNFRTAAGNFRLIQDEDQVSVIVLYRGPNGDDNTVDGLIGQLGKSGPGGGPQRWLMRKLQRYTVSVPRRDAARLLAQGDLEEPSRTRDAPSRASAARLLAQGDLEKPVSGLFVQKNDTLYDATLGLITDGAPPPSRKPRHIREEP